MVQFEKKILFITHDYGNYGAGRSLRLILQSNSGNFSLLVPKPILRSGTDFDKVSARTRIPRERVFQRVFEPDRCYVGHIPRIQYLVTALARDFIWKFTKKAFYHWLEKQDFDGIHLNSLMLHKFIHKDFPFVLHVRERFEGNAAHLEKNVAMTAGLIFIDTITKNRLVGMNYNQSIVLPNPIDMTSCQAWPRSSIEKVLKVELSDRTVFSIVGRINDSDKGVGFIVRTFKSLQTEKALLLIFGCGHAQDERTIRQLAGSDPRIKFVGEVEDQGLIYSATDVLLRGENFFSLGRTVFEGLYAGCAVVVPGRAEEIQGVQELSPFRSLVHGYAPRDESELGNALKGLMGFRNRGLQHGGKNVEMYSKAFFDFLRICGR